MSYRGPIRQWDTFWADLDFPVGSEQGGQRRPVIVVSNDGFNQRFPIVTIVPLTKTAGKKRKIYPFEVVIPPDLLGNLVESVVMPYQIRTIDRARLLEPLGRLDDTQTRSEIEDRILEHIGVEINDAGE
ncbi:MAG: type II toxin-antitoxin system PemK/MazF family toxin [Gemmatimonadaceae bacterium]